MSSYIRKNIEWIEVFQFPLVFLVWMNECGALVEWSLKLKFSRYRPGVAQRVGRGKALLFHDRGTRRGWVVSSTPRPHFTPGKDWSLKCKAKLLRKKPVPMPLRPPLISYCKLTRNRSRAYEVRCGARISSQWYAELSSIPTVNTQCSLTKKRHLMLYRATFAVCSCKVMWYAKYIAWVKRSVAEC